MFWARDAETLRGSPAVYNPESEYYGVGLTLVASTPAVAVRSFSSQARSQAAGEAAQRKL